MCAATRLATRKIYTSFLCLIGSCKIVAPQDKADEAILDYIEANDIPTSLSMEPKKFKVGFHAIDVAKLDQWIRESEERTAHLR